MIVFPLALAALLAAPRARAAAVGQFQEDAAGGLRREAVAGAARAPALAADAEDANAEDADAEAAAGAVPTGDPQGAAAPLVLADDQPPGAGQVQKLKLGFQSPATPTYFGTSEGVAKCEGGLLPITTEAECQEATALFSIPWGRTAAWLTNNPGGCFCVRTESKCYFNTAVGPARANAFLLCQGHTASAPETSIPDVVEAISAGFLAGVTAAARDGDVTSLATELEISSSFHASEGGSAYFAYPGAAALDPAGQSFLTSFVNIGVGFCRDARGVTYSRFFIDDVHSSETCKHECLSEDSAGHIVGLIFSSTYGECRCLVDGRSIGGLSGYGPIAGALEMGPLEDADEVTNYHCFERRYNLS